MCISKCACERASVRACVRACVCLRACVRACVCVRVNFYDMDVCVYALVKRILFERKKERKKEIQS